MVDPVCLDEDEAYGKLNSPCRQFCTPFCGSSMDRLFVPAWFTKSELSIGSRIGRVVIVSGFQHLNLGLLIVLYRVAGRLHNFEWNKY